MRISEAVIEALSPDERQYVRVRLGALYLAQEAMRQKVIDAARDLRGCAKNADGLARSFLDSLVENLENGVDDSGVANVRLSDVVRRLA